MNTLSVSLNPTISSFQVLLSGSQPRVNTAWLNLVYQNFAQDVGISEKKKVFLVEDNAGWL